MVWKLMVMWTRGHVSVSPVFSGPAGWSGAEERDAGTLLEYVNAECEKEVSWSGHSDRFRARQKYSGAARPCVEKAAAILFMGTVLWSRWAGHRQRRPPRVGGQGAPLTPGLLPGRVPHPSRELLRCRIAQIVRRLIIFGQRFEAGLSPLSVV